jgi:hypothetical protein
VGRSSGDQSGKSEEGNGEFGKHFLQVDEGFKVYVKSVRETLSAFEMLSLHSSKRKD